MYYYQPNNYYPQQMQQPLPQTLGLKGHPVSSLEEVRAAQIDFDGSLFVFPDIANKKIYTKQINLDGTANLNEYTLTIPIVEEPKEYVTKEELDKIIEELKASLGKKAVANF